MWNQCRWEVFTPKINPYCKYKELFFFSNTQKYFFQRIYNFILFFNFFNKVLRNQYGFWWMIHDPFHADSSINISRLPFHTNFSEHRGLGETEEGRERCRAWEMGTWARPRMQWGSGDWRSRERWRGGKSKSSRTSPLLPKARPVSFSSAPAPPRSFFSIYRVFHFSVRPILTFPPI